MSYIKQWTTWDLTNSDTVLLVYALSINFQGRSKKNPQFQGYKNSRQMILSIHLFTRYCILTFSKAKSEIVFQWTLILFSYINPTTKLTKLGIQQILMRPHYTFIFESENTNVMIWNDKINLM